MIGSIADARHHEAGVRGLPGVADRMLPWVRDRQLKGDPISWRLNPRYSSSASTHGPLDTVSITA